ncbi:MAG: putative toxin-antitoxin system toxin component, PIN family [Giesbergeria sp.]|uniref:putative toxin-antitoxin system toxin component, PIN family n=1 Tax=Giesbergeria sp. TaxID=2818473 RepID=UPI00262104CC|nr:putative toxin-antitoxin system toxin component, PIN family [Giesbergeria sp.]MDD2608068.1 putative toxin-antitoxin system toxin component, PIN family [Giesbergeria sp.]
MRVELRWPLAEDGAAPALPRALVLDTNIVLDLLVFNDPAIALVRQCLQQGSLRCLATQAMHDELERVLAYPQIAQRVAFYGLTPAQVLQAYGQQVQWVEVPARALAICKDTDDQKFIDLAAAHHALLLSKDKAVLSLRKRLLRQHGALVGTVLVAAATDIGISLSA